MGVYASIIMTALGTATSLIGGALSKKSPPQTPEISSIPIKETRAGMQKYERDRMGVNIEAWKQKYPLLYAGGKYMIDTIGKNQAGMLSPVVKGALKATGLGTIKEGDQYKQAVDLGLSPITLSQRTSQAVDRQIAMNPEWTNKISGGTLATMLANNYQNQQAFTQFLGAQNTASYINQRKQGMYNTAALTSGLLGTAAIGTQMYLNQQQNNPLSQPLNPTSYRSDVSNPGYYVNPTENVTGQPAGAGTGMTPGQQSMWNAPVNSTYMYGNTWSPNFSVTNPTPQPQGALYNPFTSPYLI